MSKDFDLSSRLVPVTGQFRFVNSTFQDMMLSRVGNPS